MEEVSHGLIGTHQTLQIQPNAMLEPLRESAQALRNPSSRAWNKDVATRPRQNLVHDVLCHRLRVQQRVNESIFGR